MSLPPLRVLLVEDDPAVAESIQRFLERSGMRTESAPTGTDAMLLKESFAPEIVLLDLELPDTDGVSLVRWLAELRDCGIIIVSGRGEEAERIVGLELGADDFVIKPPRLRELVARIRAVHRRRQVTALVAQPPTNVRYLGAGGFVVDVARRTVTDQEGRRIALTGAEFTALQVLLESRGEPVTRERLCEAALRRRWRPEDRSIDQLIFSLRGKLGDGKERGRMIQSVRGAGYMLDLSPLAEPASA